MMQLQTFNNSSADALQRQINNDKTNTKREMQVAKRLQVKKHFKLAPLNRGAPHH